MLISTVIFVIFSRRSSSVPDVSVIIIHIRGLMDLQENILMEIKQGME